MAGRETTPQPSVTQSDDVTGVQYHDDPKAAEDDYLLDSTSLHTLSDSIPKDRHGAVYVLFFIFGICSVLPWNMFITANQYFSHKLRNISRNLTSHDDDDRNTETQLQIMFESYFAVSAMISNIVFQLFNLGLQHRLSLQLRIIASLCGMLVLFILTTVLTKIDTDEWQSTFFIICLCSIVLINACGAVFQGSMFGVASVLPKCYMQAIMAGQGMGGILPSILNIISIKVSSTPDASGFIYFVCAVVCIIITIVAFIALPRFKYAAYYLNVHENVIKELETTESFEKISHRTRPPFCEIFLKIKLCAFLILMVFAVTLGLFPATVSSIKALNTANIHWANDYFIPVMCFLVFNTMDFTGRSLSVLQWPTEKHMAPIAVLVLLRLGFFPLFAFCNVNTQHQLSPLVFNNDAYPFVFNVFFGLSNGYLGSLIMIYAPKFVSTPYRETAGVMMSLFLSAGLAIGSVISILFLKLL